MNEIVSFAELWVNLETVIQSEVSQKEKNKYCILAYMCVIQKNGIGEPICRVEIESQTQRTKLWTLGGKEGCDELGNWD